MLTNQSASSSQGYGWLVRGEQRQRQHPAMEEEEPAALQPSVRGSKAAGDEGDGAPQPGQPLSGQHWDPSSPLPPTPPPQPPLWHAEGRTVPGRMLGGRRKRWDDLSPFPPSHLLPHSFTLPIPLFHIRASALASPLCFVILPRVQLMGSIEHTWNKFYLVDVFECFLWEMSNFTHDSSQ